MIERKIIEERLSQEKLRKVFEPGKDEKGVPDGVTRLRKRIAGRIQNGRDNNIAKGKTFYALDWAWEMASKQLTPTLLNTLLDRRLKEPKDTDEVENILKTWGMDISDVLVKADPKIPDSKTVLNVPMFYQVIVPLMKAYVTIRWAKIVNDRNRTPFFEYDPAYSDELHRLQAGAVTARIETMARQFGYLNVLKQRVFHMLHYGECLTFPMEEWHTEEQETSDIKFASRDHKNEVQKDDKNRMFRVVKEGIRYDIPHPSRMFYDEAHRPSTFNTNTGCSYAGFWKVVKYGEVKRNKAFWNIDRVNIGNDSWWSGPAASTFFQTVYPCTIQFPSVPLRNGTDRETKVLNNYYTGEMEDMSCVLTHYLERLVPSEYDIGDYDYPIWMRFLLAGDDTILYAAPMGYNPIIWEGYDTDENRANNNSLSLETLAFQDQFSQLCSQYVLSVKQNLANVTFVDTDPLGEDADTIIKKLQNFGEKLFRSRNFLPFSGRRAGKSQHGTPQAFFSHNFPQMNTQEIVQAMKLFLDIMERVLVMSAQEVGAAASHEQTKFEQERIHESTGTRLRFTATPTDQANETMKQQLYEALMYYGSDDFWVQIPHSPTITQEMLEKMGFTWNPDTHPMGKTDNKITVKVKKAALLYLSFAEKRDDLELRNSPEAAVAMLNMLQGVVQGPYGPAIGPDQFLEIINLCAKLAGFPKDFKLENKMAQQPQQEQMQWLMEQLTQLREGLLEEVAKGIEPIVAKLQEHEAALQRIVQLIAPPPEPAALPSPDESAAFIAAEDPAVAGMVVPPGSPII